MIKGLCVPSSLKEGADTEINVGTFILHKPRGLNFLEISTAIYVYSL